MRLVDEPKSCAISVQFISFEVLISAKAYNANMVLVSKYQI